MPHCDARALLLDPIGVEATCTFSIDVSVDDRHEQDHPEPADRHVYHTVLCTGGMEAWLREQRRSPAGSAPPSFSSNLRRRTGSATSNQNTLGPERAGGSASGRGRHSSHSSNSNEGRDDLEDQSPFPPIIVEQKEPDEQEEQVRVQVSMVVRGLVILLIHGLNQHQPNRSRASAAPVTPRPASVASSAPSSAPRSRGTAGGWPSWRHWGPAATLFSPKWRDTVTASVRAPSTPCRWAGSSECRSMGTWATATDGALPSRHRWC